MPPPPPPPPRRQRDRDEPPHESRAAWYVVGGVLAFLFVGGCVTAVAVMAVAGRPSRPVASGRLTESPATRPIRDKPAARDEWLPAFDKPARSGDVSVRVERVVWDYVDGTNGKVTVPSPDPLLSVRLVVRNESPTRFLEYATWAPVMQFGRLRSAPRITATLADDLGNTYHQMPPKVDEIRLVGPSPGTRLDPEKEMTEVLFFERPLAKATELRLSLPLGVFRPDRAGVLRLAIPTERIEWKAPK